MGQKKAPLRRCCGCMQHFEKKDLVRLVRTPDGQVVLDPTGKCAGRGAYLCGDDACLTKLKKNKRLDASLGATVPEDIYRQLEKLHGKA